MMNVFVLLNLLKLVVGAGTMYLVYNYVDISKDFLKGVVLMGLGAFIFLWALAFFVLLFFFWLVYRKDVKYKIVKIYKYTALFAFYILTNFWLLAFDFWNKWLAIFIFFCFVLLGVLI